MENWIHIILWVTGGITSLMFLQFLMPKTYLKKMLNIEMEDEAGLFFAGHWGLLAFCMGVLLIWAGFDEALRVPVMLMAGLEKAALAVWIFLNAKKAWTKKILPAAVFDTVCVLIYTSYLVLQIR